MLAIPDHLAALHALRDAALSLIATVPDLNAFAPAPEDLQLQDCPALLVPGVDHLLADCGTAAPQTEAFVACVRRAAPFANWQRTYTEAQVGADFMARYGWFELWGPSGHFLSDTARAYVAFWGAGLTYGWHWHEAEEIYFIGSGAALFRGEGMADAILHTGDTRLHLSNQPHAMDTTDQPILALVLWRGAGLSGVPYMPEPA